MGDANDIHPRNKRPVGERLAALALNGAYAQPVPCRGPEYASHTVEGGKVRVRFRNAEGGLQLKGDAITAFAIAGADKRFVPATAKIEGSEIVAWSDSVPAPEAVRYAFADNPEANLYNRHGFPMVPFRTDCWPSELDQQVDTTIR